MVLTLRKNIAFFDPDTRALTMGPVVEADQPDNRFNDGRVDPQGRFWAGTMSDKNWDAPTGHLYRMSAGGQIADMQGDIICSNGTAWSPDGLTMYHTESFRYTIWAYDFHPDHGTLSNRRSFAALNPKEKIFPDGLCVDAEGFVWSNHVGAGEVVRYSPAGEIDCIVHLPVPRAVGCTFGGDDLSTLFITSARETMTPAQLEKAPLSGSVFAVNAGVRGLPATQFVR